MHRKATILTAVTAFAAGMLCSPLLHLVGGPATADEKKTPDAFLSGGARSEKVLVEILSTLKEVKTDTGSIDELLKSGRVATGDQNGSRKKQDNR
ncbi:MAG: hypothetical protein U0996_02580 [Planctomycetaceae bacterium]